MKTVARFKPSQARNDFVNIYHCAKIYYKHGKTYKNTYKNNHKIFKILIPSINFLPNIKLLI